MIETPSTPRVIVVAPAAPGVGGQGSAAGDFAVGIASCGARVVHVGPASRLTALQTVARRRPLRRFGALGRAADRRAVAAGIPELWDVSYSMPGFMPKGSDARTRIVHSATHHPLVVRAALAAARRRTGGGQGFMTAAEAELLVAELRRADVVRAESESVAEELRNDPLVRAPVVLAPPGVDLDRFRPGPKADALTVAFVGTFSLWKGVDILVDLAGRLRGVAQLATIGGPVCSWSRRITAGAPFAPQSDVPRLLARSHALVLPSASDGFGYVVLEAMAAGAVPFVTPEVGAADLVRRLDPRLVLPPGEFAEGVSTLVTTLALGDLSRAARRLANEFDRPSMSAQAADRVMSAVRSL